VASAKGGSGCGLTGGRASSAVFFTAFFAGDFLAGDFLAGAFLVAAFLAGDFLAGSFLEGAFFAAFLTGAFFAAFFTGLAAFFADFAACLCVLCGSSVFFAHPAN